MCGASCKFAEKLTLSRLPKHCGCGQQWRAMPFTFYFRLQQLDGSHAAECGPERVCRSARPASRFANRTMSQLGGSIVEDMEETADASISQRASFLQSRRCPNFWVFISSGTSSEHMPRVLVCPLASPSCPVQASIYHLRGSPGMLVPRIFPPSTGSALRPNSTTAVASGNSCCYLQLLTVLRLLLRSQSATGVGSQQGLCVPSPPENLSEGEDESSHTGAFTTPASGIGLPQVVLLFPHA